MAIQDYIAITDIRGGMNNTDEPQSLSDDQVVDARNIDWTLSTLGGKRAGCAEITIDGSVFNRVIPVEAAVATGGVTGGASFNITIPAIANDGTGTTYTGLIVHVSSQPNTDITAVTYGGVPLTQQSQDNNATSGRLEIWSLLNPSLAGGTVTVTLAGATDAAGCAIFYQKMDQFTISGAGATNNNATPLYNNTTNPTFSEAASFSIGTGATATAAFPTTSNANLSQGNARLLVGHLHGHRPSTSNIWSLNAAVWWVGRGISIRGALYSAFPTAYNIEAVIRHTPTNNFTEDELWAVDSNGRIDRRVGGSWQLGVPFVNNNMGIMSLDGLDPNGASLHGKLFFAFGNILDSLPVWDGTNLRWTGFPSTPAAPTVTNTAAAGTYAGTRYFRIRFTEQVAGVTVRRSEPSTATTFIPGGANTGAIIAKPTGTEDFHNIYNNGQTHWEVEASLDNTIFYRIATVTIGTANYTDTTAFATGYASNTVSESVGEYTAPPSVRHVAVDEDRLIMAGNRSTTTLSSRIIWTPVTNSPGVGNDERVPATTGNRLDLDNLDGGPIEMLIAGESGNVYAFKRERIYKLTRTGILTSAYAPQTESRSRGSVRRGACSGQDQFGSPCVYFLDPSVGLCRVGKGGIEELGATVQSLWDTISPVVGRQLRLFYWPDKKQVWVNWEPGAATTFGREFLVFNTRFGGGGKGFSRSQSPFMTNGVVMGVMFPGSDGKLLPIVAGINPTMVQFNTTAVNDAGNRYRGYWTSKLFTNGRILARFGAMSGTLFANASSATIGIGLIRNLGVARRDVTISIAATASETHVFKPVDDAHQSECYGLQYEIGDPSSYSGSQLDQTWSLNQWFARIRSEEEAPN